MKLRVLVCVVILLLFALLMAGCRSGVAQEQTYETQEQTPYEVYMGKGDQGGPVLIHYLLAEHNDVVLALDTVKSFLEIDLNQNWERLSWGKLQPLVVSPQFDISRSELAQGYRSNKLETKVEDVEIRQIVYGGDPTVPGYPLSRASAAGKVTIRYLNADPEWLERHGVILNTDYTFDVDLSLTKFWSPNQRPSELISDKWRVTLARYEVTPSHRLPIRSSQ